MATSRTSNRSRYTDVVDEPVHSLLAPIKGYQEKPLVSLIDAIEPVAGFFNEIEDNVMVALHNCKKPPESLTEQESAAIHLYTMEFDGGPSLYVILNRSLRAEIREDLKPWFLYLKLFLTALYKLPSQRRRIWRGIRDVDLSSKYTVGTNFAWWGVSSCTADMKTLESEKFLGKTGKRTLFSIECIHGKSIGAHSYFKDKEQEIILMPGSYFKVLGQLNPAPGLHIIELQEITPPMTLVKPPFSTTNEASKSSPVASKSNSFSHTAPATKASTDKPPLGVEPRTELLSNDNKEYKNVQRMFLDGWPDKMKQEVKVEAIYKIYNDTLARRYQRFVDSNPKFATENHFVWHGTSSRCSDGSCRSWGCRLCQIISTGFKSNCARQDSISYKTWGPAIYFSNKSFVCHTYNGDSAYQTHQRCTIMAKINSGHYLDLDRLKNIELVPHVFNYIPALIKNFKYDSFALTRDYYVAPADYILQYNDLAALPVYIVVYNMRKQLQVRAKDGGYCCFHREYHLTNANCDGHQCQSLECTDTVCLNHNHFKPFAELDPDQYFRHPRWKETFKLVFKALGSSVYP